MQEQNNMPDQPRVMHGKRLHVHFELVFDNLSVLRKIQLFLTTTPFHELKRSDSNKN